MSSKLKYLVDTGAIKSGDINPSYVVDSIQYETIMGSMAYGVSSDNSDMDIYGFCIPPKEILFPHLQGVITGFDSDEADKFEQYQNHHVKSKDNTQEFDFSIYNITKYFRLCMDNNPNMIDSMFTPERCITHITKIGKMVRDNRKLFLHKGSYYKFKGYAYSQLNKIKTKNPEGKRVDIVNKYGYDIKFAYHLVRLLDEAKQILKSGNLNIELNREQLKEIRRGEWSLERVESYFEHEEKILEEWYVKSNLQNTPDKLKIKTLLLNCLEEFYGDIDTMVKSDDLSLVKELYKEIESIFNNIGIS